MHVVLTLEEAVILKRAACEYDGAIAAAEQLVLDRLLEAIEREQNRGISPRGKKGDA